MCAKIGFNLEAGLATQGHKKLGMSKPVIQISWPHLEDQVEAFQVGVFHEYWMLR